MPTFAAAARRRLSMKKGSVVKPGKIGSKMTSMPSGRAISTPTKVGAPKVLGAAQGKGSPFQQAVARRIASRTGKSVSSAGKVASSTIRK
jgi:hypothetical protein